jgi:hypothetical protein
MSRRGSTKVSGSGWPQENCTYVDDLILQKWVFDPPGRQHEREREYQNLFLSSQLETGRTMPGEVLSFPRLSVNRVRT